MIKIGIIDYILSFGVIQVFCLIFLYPYILYRYIKWVKPELAKKIMYWINYFLENVDSPYKR